MSSQSSQPDRLTEPLLQSIAASGRIKRYPARRTIITEGDESDLLFIILAGRLKVFTGSAEGKELIIATHGPGEYVGEMALDGLTRSASVMTLEPSTLSVVRGVDLREFLAAYPDFALNLIHKLIWRVREATIGMKSLALEDVHQRVVRLLVAQSNPNGEHRLVRDRMTHREIAERIGASPEMASRILKDLAAGGYISAASGQITILKKFPTE